MVWILLRWPRSGPPCPRLPGSAAQPVTRSTWCRSPASRRGRGCRHRYRRPATKARVGWAIST